MMNFNFFKSVASRVSLATIVALMATTMVSCDKDATEDIVTTEDPTMIGRWEGVLFDVDNNDNWIDITSDPHDEFAFTVEFREDGIFEGTGCLGNGGGTYVATSTTITIYKDGATYAHYTIKELTYTDAYIVVVINPAIFHFRLRRVFVYIEPWMKSVMF